MDGPTFKKLIQNIEDFVFIEDKIVTCIWLCQALKIHVNTAKQLLHAFVEEDGMKNKLSVIYILGGELKSGQGIQLKLVKDEDRETAKDLFSNILTNHVYSIQKTVSTIDVSNIYNSYPHFNVDSEVRQFCPIKPSKEIEKRNVKVRIVETKNEIKKPQPKEKDPVKKNASNKRELSNDADGPPSKQTKSSPEKNNKSKVAKGGIADLFSRQNDKKKAEPPSNKVEKKVEKPKPGGIGGFFQKQPAKNKDTPEPMETEDEPPPIKETNVKIENKESYLPVNTPHPDSRVKDESLVEKKDEISRKSDSQKSSIKEKKSKGKENRKKRKKRDEQEDDSRKKRKRIATVFSSDSESSGNEGSDVEMEPDPPPASIPIQIDEDEDIIPPTPGRKRIRKQINKTYTDEEGYILTKKEYVYESCTDDEGVEEKKEEPKESLTVNESKNEEKSTASTKATKTEDKKSSNKKSPVNKKSPTSSKSSNKQASIMSFFKKK